jgi:myo-inositol 2-dehydrogenase/D-chiro-inositol 1-dehydrogenase
VQVAATAHEHDALDDFSILLGFKCGLHATMKTYAHASWHFLFERLEVYGRHATYETFEMERISFTTGLEAATTTLDFGLLSRNEKWGYREEDQLFVDALEGKSPAPVTAEDGYRVIELMETCYQSARSGQRLTDGAAAPAAKGS